MDGHDFTLGKRKVEQVLMRILAEKYPKKEKHVVGAIQKFRKSLKYLNDIKDIPTRITMIHLLTEAALKKPNWDQLVFSYYRGCIKLYFREAIKKIDPTYRLSKKDLDSK